MERTVYGNLAEWKNRRDRKPLLLEGVRQCGKTYVLKEFGKRNYKDTAYFDFERTPSLKDIFQPDLDPKRIIIELGLELGRSIEPENTLVIFDEIQFCKSALTSLKYFCDEAPEYHIACAGSLLGVLLSEPNSFPVGKVNRLRMGPMSFKEFLWANSEEMLSEYIEKNDPTIRLSDPIAEKLKMYLDYYLIVGGMPAAVYSWISDKDVRRVDRILDEIIGDFMDDFSKHASEHLTKLTLIWGSIPVQLGRENKKFMFSHVKAGARSKDLEDALEWLIDAGLIHKVKRVDRPNLPLPVYEDITDFKIYMADVGILRRLAKLPGIMFSKNKEPDIYRGMISENYVLTELIASACDALCYWRSDGKAEVDFVAQVGLEIIPIEVKAGNSTSSKSMQEYIRRYSPSEAVIVSMVSGKNETIEYIPLYAAWRIPGYIMGRVRSAPIGI
ncbi:MAG: AAA family ATPase [Methanomassiliicoccaceae archaeon]|nr:AAA family ATPase [Methanomassiliicoccaceae archaeon]